MAISNTIYNLITLVILTAVLSACGSEGTDVPTPPTQATFDNATFEKATWE